MPLSRTVRRAIAIRLYENIIFLGTIIIEIPI